MQLGQENEAFRRRGARGRLESIQISQGGVPKREVKGPVEVTNQGVRGDRQRDLRYHGGPDRAVCLFSSELILELRNSGHPIDRGTTGENLTISGFDWSLVETGSRMSVGDLALEITGPASPCRKIAGSFADGDFSRLSPKLHPGRARIYARVVTGAVIEAGDLVLLTHSTLVADSGQTVAALSSLASDLSSGRDSNT